VVWEKLKIECVCLHLWQSADQLVYQSNPIKKELETCIHVSKSDWVILPVQHTDAHISQFPEIITVISKAKRSLSVKASSPHNTNPYDGQKQTKCGCLRLLHNKVFSISAWILTETDHY